MDIQFTTDAVTWAMVVLHGSVATWSNQLGQVAEQLVAGSDESLQSSMGLDIRVTRQWQLVIKAVAMGAEVTMTLLAGEVYGIWDEGNGDISSRSGGGGGFDSRDRGSGAGISSGKRGEYDFWIGGSCAIGSRSDVGAWDREDSSRNLAGWEAESGVKSGAGCSVG
jgi:hypothetical protein